MVDHHKPTTEQEFLASMTEEKARDMGYPSLEIFMLQRKLVNLGWSLSDGDESVREDYYTTLDEALTKGWTPEMLDGQQEMFVGEKLYKEMLAKHKMKV
jgi:hypothetical protein